MNSLLIEINVRRGNEKMNKHKNLWLIEILCKIIIAIKSAELDTINVNFTFSMKCKLYI